MDGRQRPKSGGAQPGDPEGDGEDLPERVKGKYGWYDPRPGAYHEEDPGGGEPDPIAGWQARAWFFPRREKARKITWVEILSNWRAVELDLQDRHIDVEAEWFERRTWRWLEMRIVNLISQPDSRLHKALTSAPQT